MKVLVVYESHFGNTRRVAEAIARGLRGRAEVEVLDIEQAPAIGDLTADLLVIGAPTHMLGLSRPDSRREALEQAGLPESSRRGIREWIGAADGSVAPVAVYDTRTLESRLPGSAARAASRQLRKRGVTLASPAENFLVHGIEGPLAPGEEERAETWARTLLARTLPRADSTETADSTVPPGQ